MGSSPWCRWRWLLLTVRARYVEKSGGRMECGGWCVFLRTYGTTPPSWRIIPGLGSVGWYPWWSFLSPRPGVVGPLPNGPLMAYKWGLICSANYLLTRMILGFRLRVGTTQDSKNHGSVEQFGTWLLLRRSFPLHRQVIFIGNPHCGLYSSISRPYT